MSNDQALGTFKDCGAVLQGHFLLTSGLHSPTYLQCALVCQRPDVCSNLCAELARSFDGMKVDAVVGPAMGGIVVAYELARQLKARGLFMERDDQGKMTLRRGFSFDPGEKVVIAEDVMTTGGSVGEIVAAVEKAGAQVVGIACLVDRGGVRRFEASFRVASILRIDVPAYKPQECPLCRQGIPVVKPGSRKDPGA